MDGVVEILPRTRRAKARLLLRGARSGRRRSRRGLACQGSSRYGAALAGRPRRDCRRPDRALLEGAGGPWPGGCEARFPPRHRPGRAPAGTRLQPARVGRPRTLPGGGRSRRPILLSQPGLPAVGARVGAPFVPVPAQPRRSAELRARAQSEPAQRAPHVGRGRNRRGRRAGKSARHLRHRALPCAEPEVAARSDRLRGIDARRSSRQTRPP